jgi:hypothetical protein
MRCISEGDLAAFVDGDLAPAVRQRVSRHLSTCERCRAGKDRLAYVGHLVETLAADDVDTAFVGDVLVRVGTASATERRSWPRRPWRWVLAVAALPVAASLAILLVPTSQTERGQFASRGGASVEAGRAVGVSVALHRGSRADVEEPLRDGLIVAPEDGYSFVVFNRSRRDVYLVVLAVDAEARAHWLYPAHAPDDKDDPAAVLVPSTPQVAALPDGVTLDAPARGSLDLVAMFFAASVHVSDIDRELVGRGLAGLGERMGALSSQSFKVRVAASPGSQP